MYVVCFLVHCSASPGDPEARPVPRRDRDPAEGEVGEGPTFWSGATPSAFIGANDASQSRPRGRPYVRAVRHRNSLGASVRDP